MSQNKLIIIPNTTGFKIIQTESILRIEALRAYCSVKLKDDTCIMVSKSLKEMQELTNHPLLFRCHKSHLVNILCIDQFRNKDGSDLLLVNGDVIPISKNKKDELIHFIQSL